MGENTCHATIILGWKKRWNRLIIMSVSDETITFWLAAQLSEKKFREIGHQAFLPLLTMCTHSRERFSSESILSFSVHLKWLPSSIKWIKGKNLKGFLYFAAGQKGNERSAMRIISFPAAWCRTLTREKFARWREKSWLFYLCRRRNRRKWTGDDADVK